MGIRNGVNSVEVNSQKPRSSVTIGVPRTSVVEKIDQGPSGPPNVLSIGTVTQGAISVSITGTAPSQVLNVVLPVAGIYEHTQSTSSALVNTSVQTNDEGQASTKAGPGHPALEPGLQRMLDS